MRKSFSRLGLALAALALLSPVAGAGTADLSTGDFTAVGTATHLGRWKNSGNITISGDGPILDVSGTVTFTTRDGDTLDALIIDGALDVSGMPFLGVAEMVIVGGTGRFEDATGSGLMLVTQLPDGSFTFTVDGVIDY